MDTAAALQKLVGATGAGAGGAPAAVEMWLDAWSDPVASLKTSTACLATSDLFSDGDWRLVVADGDRKLKVWRGTNKASEQALSDAPVALASFVPELSTPRTPAIAVAAGASVFIFRHLRPYARFTVPPHDVHPEEAAAWGRLAAGGGDAAAVAELSALAASGAALTPRTLNLLAQPDGDARAAFLERTRGEPLAPPTLITCMATLRQSIDEPDALSCLVLGTEGGRVLVLNPAGTAVVRSVDIGAGRPISRARLGRWVYTD
jgi:Bardet-Biedl syndrome 1 protein